MLDEPAGQGGAFALGDHPPHDVSAEDVEHEVEVEVRPALRPEKARDVPRPGLVRCGGDEFGLGVTRMGELIAPLAHWLLRGQDAIHGAPRAQVLPFIEERCDDLRGRAVDEARETGRACRRRDRPSLKRGRGTRTMVVEHEPDRESQARAEGVGPWTGHAGIDRRVLEMTQIVVEKIDRNPALVRVGLENIARWTRQKGGYVPQCHAEWKGLIESHPWERLREILLKESDEGQRLRSSHPFMGILTQDERDAIYAQHGIDIPRIRRE